MYVVYMTHLINKTKKIIFLLQVCMLLIKPTNYPLLAFQIYFFLHLKHYFKHLKSQNFNPSMIQNIKLMTEIPTPTYV